eukprot:Nk52_evm24s164 gene=Nk52_evmTU24s164
MSAAASGQRVVYQGVPGAYGHMACEILCPGLEQIGVSDFRKCFESLNDGSADFAVLPIQNSTAGRVNLVHQLMQDFDSLFILKEAFLDINHCLLVVKGGSLEEVKYAHSHVQALAQCRNFLDAHKIEPIDSGNTAGAAIEVKNMQNVEHAAIGSSRAGELYELKIEKEGIEDLKNNRTRFVVFSKKGKDFPLLKEDKRYVTSLMITLWCSNETPYPLACIVNTISENFGISKVESYSLKCNFIPEQFYIEVDCHANTFIDCTRKLEKQGCSVKVMGCYESHR